MRLPKLIATQGAVFQALLARELCLLETIQFQSLAMTCTSRHGPSKFGPQKVCSVLKDSTSQPQLIHMELSRLLFRSLRVDRKTATGLFWSAAAGVPQKTHPPWTLQYAYA